MKSQTTLLSTNSLSPCDDNYFTCRPKSLAKKSSYAFSCSYGGNGVHHSTMGIVTYRGGDFSTEEAPPPAEGPGPGDCCTDMEVAIRYNWKNHFFKMKGDIGHRVEPIMLIFLPIILFRNSRKSFLLFLLAAPIIPFELASAKPLRKKGGV